MEKNEETGCITNQFQSDWHPLYTTSCNSISFNDNATIVFLGVMYAVSGSVGEQPSQGFTIDIESGEILDRWTRTPSMLSSSSSSSSSSGFGEMPHDVEVSPVDGDVYVAQLNEGQITKFKHVQY